MIKKWIQRTKICRNIHSKKCCWNFQKWWHLNNMFKKWLILKIRFYNFLKKSYWLSGFFFTVIHVQCYTGLTLHDFCHAMNSIGYDMKRRVIADDRGICLKSGPLIAIKHSHTTQFDFLRLRFLMFRCNLSDVFEHVENVTMTCDTLWLLDRGRQNRRGSRTTQCQHDIGVVWGGGGGASQSVVSSKSCGVRPALYM